MDFADFTDSQGLNPSSGGGGPSAGQWSMGFGLAGLGLSIFSGMQQSKDQSQVYSDQENIANTEMQQNNLRSQQMNLNSQRSQMQNLRNLQRAQSAGTVAAAADGSLMGSGYAGSQGSERNQAAQSTLAGSQNLQLGNQMFSLDNQIDQYKISMAQSESAANSAGGLGSIGKSIMGAAGSLGQLATLA